MGIAVMDSKLRELARLISEWPGLMAGPDQALIDDSLVLLDHLGSAGTLVDVGSGAGLPRLPIKIPPPHLPWPLTHPPHPKPPFLLPPFTPPGARGCRSAKPV